MLYGRQRERDVSTLLIVTPKNFYFSININEALQEVVYGVS